MTVSKDLPAVAFIVPGDLSTPTGGYAYARALLAEAPSAGISLQHQFLAGSWPVPSPDDLHAAAALLAALPEPTLLIDGLALGAMPYNLLTSIGKNLVALHHHPLGLEPGLTPETARARLSAEAEALSACAAVITTSAATAATLEAQLSVPKHKITVAEPGVLRAAPAPRHGDPPRLLGVGTISRRKGWNLLAAALADLTHLPWQAEIVGAQDREPHENRDLQNDIQARGLADRLVLAGPLDADALAARYAAADLFVLPSRYEGYGMVVAEAMAHALPVLTTTAGALPEAAGGAARLVPPDDVPALRAALHRLLSEPTERDRLAAASAKRAQTLPSWREAAVKLSNVLKALP